MDTPVKRPRGRPPKVKRGGRKPLVPPPPTDAQSNSSGSILQLPSTSSKTAETNSKPSSGVQIGGSASQVPKTLSAPKDEATTTGIGSKRASSDGDHPTLPTKRIRTEPSEHTPNPILESSRSNSIGDLPSAADRKAIASALPARRSTRQTTVQATQISEGTLRPPGPPRLEAALSIALRNLESETWRYLWIYHKKHQGDPLPTPAAVKEACPPVRKAAEAVDKADRELEDAIDEIMRASTKKRRRGRPPSNKHLEQPPDADSTQSGYHGAETGDRRSSSLSEPEDEESEVEMTNNRTGAIPASPGTTQTSARPRVRRSNPTRTVTDVSGNP